MRTVRMSGFRLGETSDERTNLLRGRKFSVKNLGKKIPLITIDDSSNFHADRKSARYCFMRK